MLDMATKSVVVFLAMLRRRSSLCTEQVREAVNLFLLLFLLPISQVKLLHRALDGGDLSYREEVPLFLEPVNIR